MMATNSQAIRRYISQKPQSKKQRRITSAPTKRGSDVSIRRPLGFLDLPRELRDIIYQDALANEDDFPIDREYVIRDDYDDKIYEDPLKSSETGINLFEDIYQYDWRWFGTTFRVPPLAQTCTQLQEEVMTFYAQRRSTLTINERYSSMPRSTALLQRARKGLLAYPQAIVISFETFYKNEHMRYRGIEEACFHWRNQWTNPIPWLKMEENFLAQGARKVIGIRADTAASRYWTSACKISRTLRKRGMSWEEVESMLKELDTMRDAHRWNGEASRFFPDGSESHAGREEWDSEWDSDASDW